VTRSAQAARPVLIAIGAYLPQSGFTRVLLSILGRLTHAFDIHYVGMGYKGQPILTPFPIHPCNLRGGDVFGAYQGAALARELRAPVVLLLNDLWMLKNYMPAFAPVREEIGTRVVAYCPLDGRLPETTWLAPLDQVDRFVAYTQFGRDEFTRAAKQLTAAGTRFAFSEIDVIPHGVDATAFHPIAGGRREARMRLWPDRPELHGDETFIVLNANRPMPRKRIDLTIEGFARFARNTPPHVRLCLHQAIGYGDERAKVAGWVEAAGIGDRVLFTADAAPDGVTSDERLNLIYNACDVGVNTAMGEGWGLVSMEHAATRAAQIVPRHSACHEIWEHAETGEDAALFLDVVERGIPSFSLLEFATVSAAQLAEMLDRVYADPCLLHHLAVGAYGVATRPDYTWDAIADRWADLFQVLLTTGGGTAWTRP
jgi:D-inositol-3-phosphate glycosyltransferase